MMKLKSQLEEVESLVCCQYTVQRRNVCRRVELTPRPLRGGCWGRLLKALPMAQVPMIYELAPIDSYTSENRLPRKRQSQACRPEAWLR